MTAATAGLFLALSFGADEAGTAAMLRAGGRETTLSAEPKHIGWQYYAFSLTGQLADAATTTRALDAGLREGNPRLVGIAGKPAVLFTVKAGIGLGVGYLGDRVYRHGVKHRSKGFRIAGKALPIVAGAAGFIAAGVNERRRAGR